MYASFVQRDHTLLGDYYIRFSNLYQASQIFPLDHNMRVAPAKMLTKLHAFVQPELVAASIDQALRTDPYNKELLNNRAYFRQELHR